MDIRDLLGKEEDRAEPEEGAPAWYVSFADMATLLMATFLMMLSFASLDLKKFQAMAGSVQAALGVAPATQGPAPVPLPVAGPPPAAPPSQAETLTIVQSLFQELGSAADVTATDEGVTVRLDGRVLFLTGDANVKPQARPALDRVAELLRKYTFDLYILGHTDAEPIQTAQFPSNWELSGARAAAVLRYLAERGASPQRLVAVGFADSRPLAANDTPEGRARNRRVEFVFKAPESLPSGDFRPARP